MTKSPTADRRDFLKGAASAAAVLAAGTALNAHAQGTSDEIRVGVIGCGGRGSQAAENVLCAAPRVKVVALGDVFIERMLGKDDKKDESPAKTAKGKKRDLGLVDSLTEYVRRGTAKDLGNTVDLPRDRCFVGLDAYEKVINCPDVNYVILATPPGFRPLHIEACVAAGKNFFTEKPVAVDGVGIRKVLAAYEDAVKKGLCVAAGTQRRHQFGYLETMKRVHDGQIGDIAAMRVYWNNQGIWFRPRKPGTTDVAYQLDNWYHFLWICGDHIAEQHVHNLDVANWAMKGHPVRCDGIGSRIGGSSARPDGKPEVVGHIFDNFSIDYEYANGVHMYSSCRHIPGTKDNVSEALVGTKGVCQADRYTINGKRIVDREADSRSTNPYEQEHTDLINAIRDSKPLNELKNVAESTLTAIMGRMAAYTGKPVTWDFALNSKLDTFPKDLTWDSKLPVDPTPVPGKTPLI